MSVARSFARRIRGGIKRRVLHALEAVGVLPPPEYATSEPVPSAEPPSAEPPSAERAMADDADTAGPVLTREAVEELLEDMVRPALQSDGGDITLVRVDEGDVYVELVGACSTCPSATVTMRQGIERLFEAELPGFRSLIEVNGMGGPPGMAI